MTQPLSAENQLAVSRMFGEVRQVLAPFLEANDLDLSNSELFAISILSPFLMVLSSDGKVDFAETSMVETMAENIDKLVDDFQALDFNDSMDERDTTELVNLFRAKLNYLAKNMGQYEDQFIGALQLYLRNEELIAPLIEVSEETEEDLRLSDKIYQMMLMAKNSNLGDDRLEEAKIREVLKRLEIKEVRKG